MKVLILVWFIPACFFAAAGFFYFLEEKGFQSKHWAHAFVLLGAGYAVTTYQLSYPSISKSMLEDTFFLWGAAAMASALTKRLSGLPRWRMKVLVICLALLGAGVSLCWKHSVRLETFWIQAGCVLMIFFSLYRSKHKEKLSRGDRVLKLTFVMAALLLGLQCLGYLSAPEAQPVVGAWRSSIWGFFFQVTAVGIAVCLTVAILLSISLDVIDRLNTVSETDALTGLLNRRGFEKAFLRLQEAGTDAQLFFLVLGDLDHFKAINDTFGHDAGDVVLVRMATLLSEAVGADGHAGRLGGEEFAVLLAMSDLAAAVAWCDQVRQVFHHVCWPFDPQDQRRSASFGVVSFTSGDKYSETMRRADQFLYKAKTSGRNRVMHEAPDWPRQAPVNVAQVCPFNG